MNEEVRRQLRMSLSEIDVALAKKEELWKSLGAEIDKLNSDRAHILALVGEDQRATSRERSITEREGDGLIRLDQLKVEGGMRPPTELVLPDGQKRRLDKTWKSLLVEVGKDLVESDAITGNICPIKRKPDAKEVWVAYGDPNPGSGYSSPRSLGKGLRIETHGGSYELWERTCFLIDKAGGEPSSYSVRL